MVHSPRDAPDQSLDGLDFDPLSDLFHAEQHLGVRIERRRYGKPVTVVEGFDPAVADLRALSSRLKKRLGTGGTVADGRLEFQGDHRGRLPPLLAAEGYTLAD